MNKEKLSRPFHQPGATPYYDTEIAIQILEATQKEGCMGTWRRDRLEKLLGGDDGGE